MVGSSLEMEAGLGIEVGKIAFLWHIHTRFWGRITPPFLPAPKHLVCHQPPSPRRSLLAEGSAGRWKTYPQALSPMGTNNNRVIQLASSRHRTQATKYCGPSGTSFRTARMTKTTATRAKAGISHR